MRTIERGGDQEKKESAFERRKFRYAVANNKRNMYSSSIVQLYNSFCYLLFSKEPYFYFNRLYFSIQQ